MKTLRLVTTLLLSLLWMTPLGAQEPTGTIRGRVLDDATQQPIAGVAVSVRTRSALTDTDGRYLLAGLPAGTYTLQTRMIGYAPTTRSVTLVGGDTLGVDLALTGQAVGLSEIVVTGYGEQRAGDITGAVKQLTTADFNTGRIISPEQLIQSKVAGVQVVDNNEPGGGLTLRIRGATSVTASSDPLYVIDGMPLGIAAGAGGGLSAGRNPLNFLNPNDIESITVLKDASSAAIYGANAANGVVLIQTKRARHGAQVEYSGSTSGSSVTRLPSMLNAAQFRAAVEGYAPQNASQLQSANTNWLGLVDRTAYGQQHDVAISGASEAMSWRLSGGYLSQDGIIRGTNTQRLSLGLNFQQSLFNNRLDVRTNLKGSRAFDQFTPGGVLSNATQMGPTQPVFDNSTVTGYYEWPNNALQSPDNPVAILGFAKDHGTTYRSVGNIQAAYRLPFLDGLRANVNLGYDVARTDRQTFTPSVLHSQTKTGTNGSDYRANQSQTSTTLETFLNYAAPVMSIPGSIDLTGGYSFSQSHAEYPWFLAQGLSTDVLGGNGVTTARTVQNFEDIQENRLISFFGRANYNLNDRYLASVSVRRDGSSRFGKGWGTFPALSFGWRISQEPFMQGLGAVSDLKVRAGWGKTGNQSFSNYQQYSRYVLGDAQTQAQFGNQFVSTIRPSAFTPDIRWESTRTFDLGIDYGFMNQRVHGSLDWYTKNTKDMIFYVPVCAGCNLSNFATINIGSMKNRGFELSLNARLRGSERGGLGWTADFTASHNTNELVSINPFGGSAKLQQILTGGIAGGVGTNIQVLRPGLPINSFYVYQQRYDSANKPIQGGYVDQPTVRDTVACPAAPGCVGLFRPDGVINQDDLRPYHDPSPKWILGHSSYITYGNFDVSFTLRAYLGNWVYNNVASNLGTYSEVTRASPFNLHTSVLNTGFTAPQYQSDLYVEDASFLRMDNITLAYSFNYRGQPMRFFGTIQNAFTITGYSGVDPTATSNAGGFTPGFGIDNNIYPRSRVVTAGLNVRL
jgi:iron complex outermembrane receptor protein